MTSPANRHTVDATRAGRVLANSASVGGTLSQDN